MSEFLFLLKQVAKGKSITRSILEFRLSKDFLKGNILDLGAGKRDLYSNFIPREKDSVFNLFDVKQGDTIDFESDALPYTDGTYDTVLLLNVLEHLFNHTHILKEIYRIKKKDGVMIGFVPFLMWYHPDHHDFFRYTNEALEKILQNAGYTEVRVEVLHKGPYIAAFQMVYPTLPKYLRIFVFPIPYLADLLFTMLRKDAAKRYALGYYFRAK